VRHIGIYYIPHVFHRFDYYLKGEITLSPAWSFAQWPRDIHVENPKDEENPDFFRCANGLFGVQRVGG
jgi:hypothetical protein